MIFFPADPRHPPHGRIDQVIYWGAVATVADLHVYTCDFDNGAVAFTDPADLPPLPPSGAAGGDLAGSYPNPSVATVSDGALSANIPKMTAGVLPAVNGSLLTNLPVPPPPAIGIPGTTFCGVRTLNGAGQFTLQETVDFPAAIASGAYCVLCQMTATGLLSVTGAPASAGGSFAVQSSIANLDSGNTFVYIVGYA